MPRKLEIRCTATKTTQYRVTLTDERVREIITQYVSEQVFPPGATVEIVDTGACYEGCDLAITIQATTVEEETIQPEENTHD